MNEQENFNKDKITIEFLETKLRSLEGPNVPVTLKDKLLRAIPGKPKSIVTAKTFRKGFGLWGLSASAAVAVVFMLIIILDFGPSIPSSGTKDIWDNYPNDLLGTGYYLPPASLSEECNNYPNDLNAPYIEDINLVKYNPRRWNMELASALLAK